MLAVTFNVAAYKRSATAASYSLPSPVVPAGDYLTKGHKMLSVFKNKNSGGNGEIVIFTDIIKNEESFLEAVIEVVPCFIDYEYDDKDFNICNLTCAILNALKYIQSNKNQSGFIVSGLSGVSYYDKLGAIEPGITKFV